MSGTGSGLRLRLNFRDTAAVDVALRGELDLATAPALVAAAPALLATSPRRVDLDLRELSFIDIAGLRQLDLLQRELADNGIEVAVGASSPAYTRLRARLDAAGQLRLLAIRPPAAATLALAA